ncbi:MAG: hypothetical protein KAZ16_01360, partial [Psychrobacter sp.]|nr:hypothetical protein [Psychrobacter sp.]
MRLKSAPRLCQQPARVLCQDSVSYDVGHDAHLSYSHYQQSNALINSPLISNKQRGASTLVLALFVVTVLVTAGVGLAFGHKLGYQRGYYSMQAETQQAVITSKEATQELKDLRLSSKIATNEA